MRRNSAYGLLWLPLSLALFGISECAPLDEDSDGWTIEEGDCNDQAPEIHPDAPETCDLIDNDCDQTTDEGFFSLFFRDVDGDGFGDTYSPACAASPGYVAARGDCEDTDALVHPGATDSAGDGLDQDCGGSDGPQPHFGYPASLYPTLQTALDAAHPGDVLWVGPGTWPAQELSLSGKNLTLISSHLAEKTVLDAQKQSRVMRFTEGEGPSTLLDGFTITGGYIEDSNGAGILVSDASPTLTGLIVRDNIVEALDPLNAPGQGMGGGIALEDSFSRLEQSRVEGNQSSQATRNYCAPYCNLLIAGGFGGGIAVWGGNPTLQSLTVTDNRALPAPAAQTDDDCHTAGGGLILLEGSATISDSLFVGNEALMGGGIAVDAAELTLTDTRLEANQGQAVAKGGQGGGLRAISSRVTLDRVAALNNVLFSPGGIGLVNTEATLTDVISAGNDSGLAGGGGLSIFGFAPVPQRLLRVLLVNNRGGNGAGLCISYTEVELSHVTVANNIGRLAGGLYMDQCSVTIKDSLFTHNVGPNAYNFPTFPCSATISTTSIFSAFGPNENLVETGITKTWMEVDPRYISLSNDLNSANDDFHLRPDSPLRDGGTAGTVDDDGSPAELGYYGGIGALASYYYDNDDDGLYDGYEQRFWGDTAASSSESDPDQDGLTNAEELLLTTHPAAADSDYDSVDDGIEIRTGGNPLDWYRRPPNLAGAGLDGAVIARYPGDFPSLQAAVNAIGTSAEIQMAPGSYAEHLLVAGKALHLHSTGSRTDTVWTSSREVSLLTGLWSDVTVERFTFTGGNAYYGGAIDLHGTDATVRDVTLENNVAIAGGGLRTEAGRTLIENSDIRWNRSESRGGGLSSRGPELTMRFVHVLRNESTESAGGGINIGQHLSARLENVHIEGNISELMGGGLNAESPASPSESRFEMLNVAILRNTSAGYGGGLTTSCNVIGQNIVLAGNTGSLGGAYYAEGYTSSFRNLIAVANSTDSAWSGIVVSGSPLTEFTLIDSVLAYNEGFNLYALAYDVAQPTITLSSTVLYNPGTKPQHNLTLPGPGLWTFEPGFLSYDDAGLPTDLHLALNSRLINAGTSPDKDADGSAPDVGLYGGPQGALWDLDADGLNAYFWPGQWTDSPPGINRDDYDSVDDASPSE